MSYRLHIPVIDASRTRRTVELLAVIWLLAMADLFFTIWAQLFTPFQELNPIARLRPPSLRCGSPRGLVGTAWPTRRAASPLSFCDLGPTRTPGPNLRKLATHNIAESMTHNILAGQEMTAMCPRSESPGTYMSAITGELVLGGLR